MQRVLALHEDYPNNKSGLAGKLGKLMPYKTALEMPGMKHRAKRNYEGGRKTTPDIAAQRQTHPVRLAADRWRLKKSRRLTLRAGLGREFYLERLGQPSLPCVRSAQL